jgi:hypothetical protein
VCGAFAIDRVQTLGSRNDREPASDSTPPRTGPVAVLRPQLGFGRVAVKSRSTKSAADVRHPPGS